MKSEHPTVTERRTTREAPGPHFARVSAIWSAILGVYVSPAKVCLLLAALKVAREAGQHDPDNINDAQGYLSLIEEVQGSPFDPRSGT